MANTKAKGVPHALTGRRPEKPIIRPRRLPPKVVAAQAAAKRAAADEARVAEAMAKADEARAKVEAGIAREAVLKAERLAAEAAEAAKAKADADAAEAAKADADAAEAAKADADAAEAAKADEKVEVPLELLDLSVKAVGAALETGEYDAHLADLLAAEKADKNRKGAVSAIEARMA